jgi:hypothetical protein
MLITVMTTGLQTSSNLPVQASGAEAHGQEAGEEVEDIRRTSQRSIGEPGR